MTIQSHQKRFTFCPKHFGRQDVYPSDKPTHEERAPQTREPYKLQLSSLSFLTQAGKRRNKHRLVPKRRRWNLRPVTAHWRKKVEKKLKCEKTTEKEREVYEDSLLKWVKEKSRGALKGRFCSSRELPCKDQASESLHVWKSCSKLPGHRGWFFSSVAESRTIS